MRPLRESSVIAVSLIMSRMCVVDWMLKGCDGERWEAPKIGNMD